MKQQIAKYKENLKDKDQVIHKLQIQNQKSVATTSKKGRKQMDDSESDENDVDDEISELAELNTVPRIN
jgi:hypothetical protein